MISFVGRFAALIFLFWFSQASAQYYNLQGFWHTQNLGTDVWITYNPSGAPTERQHHTAVWTGSKMLIWGGENSSLVRINTGGIYDPVGNSWATITTTGAPAARKGHTALWTGTRMIIWGGEDGATRYNDGAIYDPGTDSWTSISTTSAPTTSSWHSSVWTGTYMLIWGGDNNGTKLNTGGKYNLATNTWTAITTTSAPTARSDHKAVWSGSKMIVWGGYSTALENTGGVYDPAANSWTATSTGANVPDAREYFGDSHWTGTKMIVWGGLGAGATKLNTGALYTLSGNSWTTTNSSGAPGARQEHATAWTGEKFFVWGGADSAALNTGAVYDAAGNSWTATSMGNAPAARTGHTAIWTGTAILVWGGLNNTDTAIHAYVMTAPGARTFTVDKVYPTNGDRFLNYIKGNNGGTNFFNQKDEACAGTETNDVNACIHGGDKLKVQITGYNSCAGMTITDTLGLFEWICVVESGNVTFYSPGFKTEKGLMDAIDFTGVTWRSNSVSVDLNAQNIGTSASSAWWNTTNNPLTALPSSTGAAVSLSGYPAGTILIQDTSANSYGYNINQDKLGLVIKDGATLTYTGNVNNCNDTNGETASANYKYLICTGSQKYLWVEGSLTDSGSSTMEVGLGMFYTKFSRFNKVTIPIGAYYASLEISYSAYNSYSAIKIQKSRGGDWYSIALYDVDYSFFNKIHTTQYRNGTSYPLFYGSSNSTNNIFHDIIVSQSIAGGLNLAGTNNTVTHVLATGIQHTAIQIDGSQNTVSHATTSQNGGCVLTNGTTYTTVNQILCYRAYHGIRAGGGGSNHIFSQIAHVMDDQFDFGPRVDIASEVKFTNNMIIHSTATGTRCLVNGGTNPGTNDTTCGNQGSSDANWVYFALVTPDNVVGNVTSESVNPETTGVEVLASIADFYNFENPFRTWVSAAQRYQCDTGNCQIVDWRLKSGDTLLRNKSLDGSSANAAFVADSTCPAAVHGNKALTDLKAAPNTFLINAEEIVNDGLGDEDGLCESSESCIYSPNFGAYQGEGEYRTNGTCLFQDGTVTNVKMYAYPTNGG